MLKTKDEGIILEKTNLEFESKAILNPACIQVSDITHMFYRAVDQNDISSIGYCQLVNNKVLKRLSEPLFFPKVHWEKNGIVNNVVFPIGAVVKNKKWQYQI